MARICFDSFLLLSQAQNWTDFERIVKERNGPKLEINSDKKTAKEVAKLLSSDYDQAQTLVNSLRLLHDAAINCESSKFELLFPDGFPSDLKALLAKCLYERRSHENVETETDPESRRTMPLLVGVNWRVDTKLTSNVISRFLVPTCLLQLKIQQQENDSCDSSTVHIELTKEAMDTMLDGLGKIRDQLSTISQ